MKIVGWICLIIGSLAFIGAIIKDHNITGPVFFLGLGIYLLHISNKKKLEKKDKEKWNNNSTE